MFCHLPTRIRTLIFVPWLTFMIRKILLTQEPKLLKNCVVNSPHYKHSLINTYSLTHRQAYPFSHLNKYYLQQLEAQQLLQGND